jgi:hypothetical protein
VRLRLLRAVIAPQREDGGGGAAADVEPPAVLLEQPRQGRVGQLVEGLAGKIAAVAWQV